MNGWSLTGKARSAGLTPKRGDIPAKNWRIHPRPKAVAFCCRGKAGGKRMACEMKPPTAVETAEKATKKRK